MNVFQIHLESNVLSQVQGTEKEERLRVRRARSSDVPGVLKFVRENASTAWPGLVVPQSVSDAVVSDYVSRALAQGKCSP